uniref:restriction endonuclease n=1 Tax=Dietzia sp. oral taxon 368 TaxID=712270 RepID=UPI0026C0DBEF
MHPAHGEQVELAAAHRGGVATTLREAREGRRAAVFITTSTFSAGAIAEAERINARIELIDGPRLAELLVAYGVGVQAEQTVTLYRLDEDFFESL